MKVKIRNNGILFGPTGSGPIVSPLHFFILRGLLYAFPEEYKKVFRKCLHNNGGRGPNGSIIKMLMVSSVHINKLK